MREKIFDYPNLFINQFVKFLVLNQLGEFKKDFKEGKKSKKRKNIRQHINQQIFKLTFTSNALAPYNIGII